MLLTLTIFAIYRPPSFRNTTNFLTSLNTILKAYSESNKTLIIAGDLNIDILATASNQDIEYLCLMAENGLFSAITKPTRENACLDHIFVNKIEGTMGVICNSDVTDHVIVILALSLSLPSPKTRNQYKIKHDIVGIKKELNEVNWSKLLDFSCVNENANTFCSQLYRIIHKYTRVITLKRNERIIKPWITPGLIRCMRHRDRLHLQTRKHPDDVLKRLFILAIAIFATTFCVKLNLNTTVTIYRFA